MKKVFLLLLITGLYIPHVFAKDTNMSEKRSTHFIVHFHKDVDTEFIKNIIDAAEDYYDDIADALGFRRFDFWLWEDRARIYIYGDKESFRKATNKPEWSGGCANYENKEIKTYPHAAGFFDSLLPHELGHIIFREFVGTGRNVPLWLDEGVASYQEKSKRYAAKAMVKESMRKKTLLSMEELVSFGRATALTDQETIKSFYAQSVSIIYFIINKYGKNMFIRLCRNLKKNMSLDRALKDASFSKFRDTQELYDAWLRYIKK